MKKYINKKGFLIRPKNISLKIVAILGVIFTILVVINEIYLKPEIIKCTPAKMIVQEKYDTIKDVLITFYQATDKQCGNSKGIGASGIKCKVGDCAVTQPILDWYCDYNDTIIVCKGSFKGRYRVVDKSNSNKKFVDIFKPLDWCKPDCYKSDIAIKRHE